MSYCANCGNELQEEKFCPNCGAEAMTGVAPRQQKGNGIISDMEQREYALEQMNNLIAYFGKKQEQYDEFSSVLNEITILEQKSSMGLMIVGGIWLVAMLLFTKGMLAATLFLGSPGIVLIVISILMKKKNTEKIEKAKQRQEMLSAELTDYYMAYENCPIGIEYTFPLELSLIYDVIRSGKANTISDALNKYLDDVHKTKVENMAEETRRLAEETAHNTREAAKSAKKAANYSAASYWFK